MNITHMADGMLHTLCNRTHQRIYNNLDTWTYDESEVDCEQCLKKLKKLKGE